VENSVPRDAPLILVADDVPAQKPTRLPLTPRDLKESLGTHWYGVYFQDRKIGFHTSPLKRTGEGFLVITKDPWEIFFEGVEQLSDKFLHHERVQPELEPRD